MFQMIILVGVVGCVVTNPLECLAIGAVLLAADRREK